MTGFRTLVRGGCIGLCAGLAGAGLAGRAQASEGGASIYLLGSTGPEAAVMPPLQGVFFDNTFYFDQASAKASTTFQINGNLVAGVNAQIAADFATVLWVPSTHFLGGTLGLGAALPIGEPLVNVSVAITGPHGNTVGLSRSDASLFIGDPILTAAQGWAWGNFHLQGSTLINVPIGQYNEGRLSNLSFHRWAEDLSVAGTWHDDKSGWDVSGKVGVTFNGENPATNYVTGTESHYEVSVGKALNKTWAISAQSYYFNQITGDSGVGNKIGPFMGRVTGVGGTLAYTFNFFHRPSTLKIRGFTEFDAQNRLQSRSFWLDWSFPLYMKLPKAAPHAPPGVD